MKSFGGSGSKRESGQIKTAVRTPEYRAYSQSDQSDFEFSLAFVFGVLILDFGFLTPNKIRV